MLKKFIIDNFISIITLAIVVLNFSYGFGVKDTSAAIRLDVVERNQAAMRQELDEFKKTLADHLTRSEGLIGTYNAEIRQANERLTRIEQALDWLVKNQTAKQ